MTADPFGIGHLYALKADPLHYLTAAAWTVGDVAAREFELAHRDCDLSTFCRNPLHPGPCKGWKKHLGLVAPGALHALERVRHDQLEAKRKAKVKALQDAGHPVPKKLLQPITYDPAKNKHIGAALEDPELKAMVEQPITAPTKKQIEVKLDAKHAEAKAAADAAAVEAAAAKEAAEKAKLALVHQTVKQAGLTHGDVAMYSPKAGGAAVPVKVNKTGGAYKLTNEHGHAAASFGSSGKKLLRKATPDEAKEFLAKEKSLKEEVSAKVVADAKKAGTPQVKQMSEPKPATKKSSDLATAVHLGTNEDVMDALAKDPGSFDGLTSEEQDTVAGKLHSEAMMGNSIAHHLIDVMDIPDPGTSSTAKPHKAGWIDQGDLDAMLSTSAEGFGPGMAKTRLNLISGIPQDQFDALPAGQKKKILDDLAHIETKLGSADDKAQLKGVYLKLSGLGEPKIATPEGSLSTNPLGKLVDVKASNTEVMHGLNAAPELFDSLSPEQKQKVKLAVSDKALLGTDVEKATANKLMKEHGLEDKPQPVDEGESDEPDVLGELLDNVGNDKFMPTASQPAHVQAAIAIANGHKSSTAKMQLAAYVKVSPTEFESMSPTTQKLVLANLTGMQKKFVDPKKVAVAHELHVQFSKAAGGGAGAGGAADATHGDASAADFHAKAQAGAKATVGLGLLTGVDVGPQTEASIAKVIEKMHKNGTTSALLDNYAAGPAQALADMAANEVPVSASVWPHFEEALKHDVYHVMAQDGTPTPLLDAVKEMLSALPNTPQSKAGAKKVTEAFAEHPVALGQVKTKAAGTSVESLLDHAGEVSLPSHIDAGNEEMVASWIGAHALSNAFVDSGLSDKVVSNLDDDPDGFTDKVEHQLVQDYLLAMENDEPTPGGLAAQMPLISEKVSKAGKDLIKKNGWAEGSPAVESFQQALFQSMVQDAMDNLSAGTGGSSTPAPAIVEQAVAEAVTPGGLSKMQKATLKQAYKSLGGTYLNENSAQENFDALNAVASAYADQEGIGTLTFGQVMDAVDEVLATEVQASNAGLLRKKIEEFLATPGGKAYVNSASPKPSLIATLTGKKAEAAEVAKWKNGVEFPKYPGPGPFVPTPESSFKGHTVASSKELHDATLKKLKKKITPEQKAALVHYSGSGAAEMNGWLRSGSSGYGINTIKEAHAVEEAMYPIQEDMRLLRRTGWEFVPPQYRSLAGIKSLIGGTFKDDGFMSTTMAMQPGSYGTGKPVELSIEAPKGTRGFHLDHWSHFKGVENEFLLGAGQVMQVVGAEQVGGKVVVRVRVVTP